MAEQNRSLLVASMFAIATLGQGAMAWGKPPKLTSLELPAARCPAKEQGGPRRCAPQSGFSVIDTKTDLSDFRMVVQEDLGFQIFLEPAGCEEVRYDKPLQWRLYDDQPFAVIQPAQCIEPQAPGKDKKKPSRTVVVVRGLHGFEGLHAEFDLSKNKSGYRDAIEAADRFLKAAWPKLEERRVAAAAAADKEREKLEASAEEKEERAATPVPAAHKRGK